MLFNYHVKEKCFDSVLFLPKNKQNGKKAAGARREDHTALAEIGTVTYCTL